jgi:hypothetical protein
VVDVFAGVLVGVPCAVFFEPFAFDGVLCAAFFVVIRPIARAACGVEELWVFDPKLEGPKHAGGPHRLQIWRRHEDEFAREYAGDGPARSEALDAWIFAVSDGERLRIADDRAGSRWWKTTEEEARDENAALVARVAELEAELARTRGRS